MAVTDKNVRDDDEEEKSLKYLVFKKKKKRFHIFVSAVYSLIIIKYYVELLMSIFIFFKK